MAMRVLGADIFVEVAVRGLAVQLSEKKAKKWKNELEVWQEKKDATECGGAICR